MTWGLAGLAVLAVIFIIWRAKRQADAHLERQIKRDQFLARCLALVAITPEDELRGVMRGGGWNADSFEHIVAMGDDATVAKLLRVLRLEAWVYPGVRDRVVSRLDRFWCNGYSLTPELGLEMLGFIAADPTAKAVSVVGDIADRGPFIEEWVEVFFQLPAEAEEREAVRRRYAEALIAVLRAAAARKNSELLGTLLKCLGVKSEMHQSPRRTWCHYYIVVSVARAMVEAGHTSALQPVLKPLLRGVMAPDSPAADLADEVVALLEGCRLAIGDATVTAVCAALAWDISPENRSRLLGFLAGFDRRRLVVSLAGFIRNYPEHHRVVEEISGYCGGDPSLVTLVAAELAVA